MTFSCHTRKPYLSTPASRNLFERSLEQTRQRFHRIILGYVVMPEHVHLLLTKPHAKAKTIDTRPASSYSQMMEVQLTPDLQSKLTRLAEQQGRDSEALVTEAVERLVNHDEWFVSEVERGLAAADRDELVGHETVRAMIDSRYPA